MTLHIATPSSDYVHDCVRSYDPSSRVSVPTWGGTEFFFPIGTTGPALERAERAKQVCAVCPVKAICLQWAPTYPVTAGIWGGLDEDERRNLRRARTRRKAAHNPTDRDNP